MDNKVYYSFCSDYSVENVDKSVEFVLNNFEILTERLKTAKKVLIKPNLLSAKNPDMAITTHPQFLISLINKIKRPDMEIIIADSPAGEFTQKHLDKVYSACGMNRVAQETGVKLNYDLSEHQVYYDEAVYAKSFKCLQVAQDADLIINFAKLKTHCFALITCSVKNHFGLIPGLLKVKYHLSMAKPEIFSNMLIDIERYFEHKTVNFIDGVVGMEGFGPSNGKPIEANCLLAGNNPSYLDILACKIMGVDPQRIYTLQEAKKRSIVTNLDFESLDLTADSDLKTYNFKLPPDRVSSIPFLPQKVVDRLDRFFVSKPVINASKCVGCRECERICPPQVMKILDKKAKVEDYAGCISCYCCQEVCPHDAIGLNNPPGKALMAFMKKL